MCKFKFSFFSKTEVLSGTERDKELMGEKRDNKYSEGDGSTRNGYRYLADELVKADKDGKVVYCRLGKQYITNLEK